MTDLGLIMIRYIQDTEHYTEVLSRMMKARRLLWIATADLKDLYVKHHGEAVPFLKVLSDLVKRGVEVRLLHAKEPGPAFREDFDKYPALWDMMERRLCNRVHMKIISIDSEWLYIGSANMTGAGMGMKSQNRRNFEAGIMTDDETLIDQAMAHYDKIWNGDFCSACGRKDVCIDKIC